MYLKDWLSAEGFERALPFALVVAILLVSVFAVRQPLWAEAFRRLRRNRMAVVSLAIIGAFTLVGVMDCIGWRDAKAADFKTLLDRAFSGIPKERTYSAPLAAISAGEPEPKPTKARHLLGTDGLGQDVLYRTLKGCRTALVLAGLTSLIATPLALLLGLLAGYFILKQREVAA